MVNSRPYRAPRADPRQERLLVPDSALRAFTDASGSGSPPASGMPRKTSTTAGDLPTPRTSSGRGRQPQPAGQHAGGRTSRAQPNATTWNTELSATRTAAASRSPQARSFQISTIAMQRARPTMIRPVRYSGRSGRNSQASANISAGAEDPVEHQRGDHRARWSRGDRAELAVADLGQHRIHHHQQTDRDRQRDRPDLDRVQRLGQAGHQPPEQQPERHRGHDPHRQEPVEAREPADDPVRGGDRWSRRVVDRGRELI